MKYEYIINHYNDKGYKYDQDVATNLKEAKKMKRKDSFSTEILKCKKGTTYYKDNWQGWGVTGENIIQIYIFETGTGWIKMIEDLK